MILHVSEPEFAPVADACAAHLGLAGEAQVEVVFCSKKCIRAVNAKERGVDAVTDVLSFPSLALRPGEYPEFCAQNFPLDRDPHGGGVILGSVLICDAVAKEQAVAFGHGEARERAYLFLHGLLHLLGFDHVTDADRAKMRAAEEAILAHVGLSRGE